MSLIDSYLQLNNNILVFKYYDIPYYLLSRSHLFALVAKKVFQLPIYWSQGGAHSFTSFWLQKKPDLTLRVSGLYPFPAVLNSTVAQSISAIEILERIEQGLLCGFLEGEEQAIELFIHQNKEIYLGSCDEIVLDTGGFKCQSRT